MDPLVLNKTLPWFFSPLGVVLILIAFGTFRNNRIMTAAGGLLLWFLATPAISEILVSTLEDQTPQVKLQSMEGADAVVVLGGILRQRSADLLDFELGEEIDRFEKGVSVVNHGKADWLVLSSGGNDNRGWPCEGDRLRVLAQQRGVPESRIIVTEPAGNTEAEAAAVAKLVQERGWKRIALVTSAFHLPRASRQFTGRGFEFVSIPADFRIEPTRSGLSWVRRLMPSADGLRHSEMAGREWLGIAFYSARRIFQRTTN